MATTKTGQKLSTAERRALRTETTRNALIEAAGRVIGKYGYSGCSIARVTTKAKIAHGAFYLYFKSQQELFDSVLPILGRRMLDYVADRIGGSTSLHELERLSIEANFEYLGKHPYMYRVLYEAEPFIPDALEQYLDSVNRSYARSLRRTLAKDLSDKEYYILAAMLIGIRTNLTKYYGLNDNVVHPLPDKVVDIYLQFATTGVQAAAACAEQGGGSVPDRVIPSANKSRRRKRSVEAVES